MPKLKPPLHLFFLLLHLLLLPHPSRSALNRPNYHEFLLNATHLPPSADYDYIVVGGGTAGCPLAATLSHHFKVLLLERGGRYRDHPNLLTQEGFLLTLLEGGAGDSPAQLFTSEDGVTSARGRVLGGSSSINAGFYSRGDGAFFAATAAAGWDMSSVNRSYQWVERAVVSRPQIHRWQSAVRDALLDAGVAPFNGYTLDHVTGTKIGGTLFDRSGRRRTAADLLGYATAGNIEVVLHAVVDRVLFAAAANPGSKQGKAAPAAIGVVYRDRAGKHHRATVRDGGEVILSAGAIGTPQLLLLSGVGPRSYLSSLGIPVTSHSPNVGRYLYDNPRNGVSLVSPTSLDASLIQVVGITDAGAYFEAASNVLPFFPPSSLGLLRDPASPIHLTVVTLMEKVVGPGSHGSLRLATIDARDNPIVRFNYFLDPADLAHCVGGVRKLGEVLRSRAMAGFRFPRDGGWEFRYVGPALPDEGADNGTVAEYCRRTVTTIWHYHGGCVLGKVVGGDLRVLGVAGLRVVDGSVFPVSPGTNPQATVMMLGRYMGLKITQERLQAAGS